MEARRVTAAEAGACGVVLWLAANVLVAYAWDALGFTLQPLAILAVALALSALMAVRLRPLASSARGEVVAAALIGVTVLAWLLWLAWPALLPPGGGPDLTHHLLLIDYIERHWRLVHDPAVEAFLGEMAAYTPGSHLLAALAGAWSGRGGLHALYPVVAVTVAVKCALVFLVSLRVIGGTGPRVPLAVTSVVLLLLPHAYLIGSFTHDSFMAQVVSELFAVAMLWALVAWDEQPATAPMMVFGAAGAAAFLTWPVWIGAPMATLVALLVTRRDLPFRDRLRSLLIGVLPIAVAAAVHVAGRLGWVAIVQTSGAVLMPSVEVYGWLFLVLAALGLPLTLVDRRRRALLIFVFALSGQTVALLLVAQRSGAESPYMALKMAYLALYPQAIAGAVAVAAIVRLGVLLASARRVGDPVVVGLRAWVPALLLASAAAPGLIGLRTPSPVITEDFVRAGRWARVNVPRDCVDYLVAHRDVAYWLHLAALGNPRMSERTAAIGSFDANLAIGGWIAGEAGGAYAIADAGRLPNEVLDRADVLARFGEAAVLKRRGPTTCGGS